MRRKTKVFFLNTIELLERFLECLWKSPLKVIERKIYPQERDFTIDFIINKLEIIRMKGRIEQNKDNIIIRLKYTSHYNQDFEHYEACLFLSFCYKCPEELELCNQYGLYKKEDIRKIESSQNVEQIYNYQKKRNLLGDNQIFIFNMKRIGDHCCDKVLNQILQEFDRAFKSVYY